MPTFTSSPSSTSLTKTCITLQRQTNFESRPFIWSIVKKMWSFGGIWRSVVVVVFTLSLSLAGLIGLLKPIPDECDMTYMWPSFVPIFTPNVSSRTKYELFLYRDGRNDIGNEEHLKKLSGVPVLFIPGNGGSYKQVRSLGQESETAYKAGPLERIHYPEAYPTLEEGVGIMDDDGFRITKGYASMLDWFAVDLKGEYSAMDSRILEDQAAYVVYAIHRILDQYKESHAALSKEGVEPSGNLPRSVILVGHSLGGFVARAAVVHPNLKKGAVETILTLSSPHQSPVLALQPSLAYYYSRVNRNWRRGYQVQTADGGGLPSETALSSVVVISLSGGIYDHQIRSKLASLDSIVPPTHGFTMGSTGMKNVWVSTGHQVILWCNQVAVQVSHTLLSLIDSDTGQPFASMHKRLYAFIKMLRSGIPQSFNWMSQVQQSKLSKHVSTEESQGETFSSCPNTTHWSSDGPENDLDIQTTTFTVSAMDGKRRWLDIRKLGSDGRNHFLFVTNLTPCSGVRLHLWPEKGNITSEVLIDKRVVDVTPKMVRLPAPRQTEPGSLTQQAPPSSVLQLGPDDIHGFKFLTISVATTLDRLNKPPSTTTMAVGQFFNPDKGRKEFSQMSLLLSSFTRQELFLMEDHPLSLNLSFSISLGLLPVTLSLKAVSCEIKKSLLPVEETKDMDRSKLCKQHCFPPVAVAWDSTSGVHIIPNLYTETIVVDSSPAFWSSKKGTEKTMVLLMLDPLCSYRISFSSSVTAAAGRFMLMYYSQIVGFSFALVFFALMRQTDSWKLGLRVPSMLTAIESNLMPFCFLWLGVVPIILSLVISLLISQTFPPFASFFPISIICYAFSNGLMIILIMISRTVFYLAATLHIFLTRRCQVHVDITPFKFIGKFLNIFSTSFSLKVVRILRDYSAILTAIVSFISACFVHPALGLFILLLSQAIFCHNALFSFLTASSHCHAQKKALICSSRKQNRGSRSSRYSFQSEHDPEVFAEKNLPDKQISEKHYSDTQLEIFNHCHSMLVLHFLATLMFVPSLVAWLQSYGMMGWRSPELLDLALCVGVNLHALYASKPRYSSVSFTVLGQEVGMSLVYLLAGYYCYISGLALAPYRAFDALAAVGFTSFSFYLLGKNADMSIVYPLGGYHRYLSDIAMTPYVTFFWSVAVISLAASE